MFLRRNKKVGFAVVIFLILLRFPYKFSINEKEIKNYTTKGYIIEYYPTTEGIYLASRELNPNLKEDISFVELTGKSPYYCLNTQFEETWENGVPPVNNKYYICGYIYGVGSEEVHLYGFYVERWDIVGHVNRKDILPSIVLPFEYLTWWDIDWSKFFRHT